MEDVFPHLLAKGQEGFPVGKPVAHKGPINPKDHVEEKDIGRCEMDESYSSKPIRLAGFCPGQDGRGICDNKTGRGQYRDAKHIDPVEDPDRKFPDIYAFIVLGWHRFWF
jgi:hypothetical protein